MEIDEHLKYTMYVFHPHFTPIKTHDPPLTSIPQQLAIRPLPQGRRANGLAQNARLLLVISAAKSENEKKRSRRAAEEYT